MINYFFTADPHFNHTNIIKYCGRPFKDAEEMNETIVQNWNSVVKQNDDIVYLIGDVGFGNLEPILKRLNGQIILIKGGHDRDIENYAKFFKRIYSLYEFKQKDISITLCHFAMRTWNKSHFNTWHLFGHSHGTLQGQGKSFDVGVDCWKFTPLSLEQVMQEMKKRPDNFNLIKNRRD